MANDSPDYSRRCSELNLDPDVRVGRLTYVCKLRGKRKLCGVMFLCDCGRFCKVDITTVMRWSGARADLPWECPKCIRWRRNLKKGAVKRVERNKRIKAQRSLARQRLIDRKVAEQIPIRGRFRKDFPAEYRAWTNIRCRKDPCVKRWEGEKGFERFLKDLGPKPFPYMSLVRRDRTKPQGPENSYWADMRAKRKEDEPERCASLGQRN